MATDVSTSTGTTTDRGWKPYRLTVDQFLAMIDVGIFPPQVHVELLQGIMVETMTKGDLHDTTLGVLCEQLRRLLPEEWCCREDKSLQLTKWSRPEPDVAIIPGPLKAYVSRTPHARETALVVEVAESSYPLDRGEKWRAYASAHIPIYWIVNLNKAQIEVYTDPIGRGKSATYRQAQTFAADAEVPVVIDGQDVGRIAVKDVLP